MSGKNDINTAKNVKTTRRIVIIVFDGANALDVAGPSTVFSSTNQLRQQSYKIVHASVRHHEASSSSGLCFSALTPLTNIRAPIDTLLLAGGEKDAIRRVASDAEFLALLRRLSGRARRVASVCTGAFLLAAAGLLNGRRAVTHWASCDLLSRLFPGVQVEPDAVYVRDGKFVTSAGVSAGIDLSLALVEEDFGSQVASAVAKSMVVYLRRPGGQAQFSSVLIAQTRGDGTFGDLVAWLAENLTADLSVDRIASRCGMSSRTFHRHFTKWAGQSPAAFVRALRVESARNWLETTDWPLKRVAQRAGFGSVDTLERAWARHFGVTPGETRERFGNQGVSEVP